MSRDGVAEQLFPSTGIARRMLLASFAIFGLRRSTGKPGQALEIAEVPQCALQPFCRPLQTKSFGPTPQVDGFRERFKHIAEAFGLDPQLVTAGRARRLQVPSFAG